MNLPIKILKFLQSLRLVNICIGEAWKSHSIRQDDRILGDVRNMLLMAERCKSALQTHAGPFYQLSASTFTTVSILLGT